jgi:thymidylate synthase
MNNAFDHTYLDMMDFIIQHGTKKGDRTGTGVRSVFGYQMRFDLSNGTIPLLTSKRVHTKSIIHELLWFLSGDTNIKYLNDNGVTIWDEWADEKGNLGPVYGSQWRDWKTSKVKWTSSSEFDPISIDQISMLVDQINSTPDSRRLMVNAWNVGELDEMKLPPCHYSFQCYVSNNELSLLINQRSCDTFLGVPFNICQYSMLLCMLAEVCGYNRGELIWNGGDVHIYSNHMEQAYEQLSRRVTQVIPSSPTLKFAREVDNIFDFKYEDFIVEGYEPLPAIKAPVAV